MKSCLETNACIINEKQTVQGSVCVWVHVCLYTCVRVHNPDLMKADGGVCVLV